MPLRDITAADERALQDIADALAKSHKQVLITGAGISTSCGIPVCLGRQRYTTIRADVNIGFQI